MSYPFIISFWTKPEKTTSNVPRTTAITSEKATTNSVNLMVWRRFGQVTFKSSERDALRYSKIGFTKAKVPEARINIEPKLKNLAALSINIPSK
jgi:hypothetical protein